MMFFLVGCPKLKSLPLLVSCPKLLPVCVLLGRLHLDTSLTFLLVDGLTTVPHFLPLTTLLVGCLEPHPPPPLLDVSNLLAA